MLFIKSKKLPKFESQVEKEPRATVLGGGGGGGDDGGGGGGCDD